MLHCGNYMPVPIAHSTVGYSVTFPVLPYQTADITELSEQQKSVCSYSGNASEATCEKCRSEKIESLNRQLYELVKKHGLVEVAGKEILGWYMLLSTEDRRLIKEYGHISGYIKDNPSLSIVNNWVQLKSKSSELLESCSFSMENSHSPKDNSAKYIQDYCDKMLKSSGHADIRPQNDALWFEGANDFKKGDLDPMNKSLSTYAKSSHLEIWDNSTVGEHKIVFDTKDVKGTPVLPLEVPNNQGTARDLSYVTTCLTKEPLAEKQYVSECDLSFNIKLKTDKNFKEHESALSKGYENSAFDNYTSIANFKENCLNLEASKGVLAQDERKSMLPSMQCFSDVADSPVDYDCSSVGTLDDETFFSVKSGSFYSRSSSPVSLDEEQYVFEETLEDLSSFSMYRQSHNSQIVPFADVQSLVWDPSSEIKNVEHPGKTTIDRKTKQRNVSCNTDLSCVSVSFNDKETQTKTRSTQDTGVNTDPIESGLFSQAAALKIGITKDAEESKGAGGSFSLSPEALLQRAVKAELQLVDVQRWLGWQMCWKTQQQTLEKQSFFNLSNESSEQSARVTSFNLSSALAEVEEKYQEMRARIQSGTPLDALVPLTMQLTTVETSSDNLRKDPCQHSGRQNVSDVPAEDLKGTKCMKNDFEGSFMSHLAKCEQKTNEHLSEKPSHYYVHVGNIAPCVKEGELMDIFRKYHVFNVFLEESSLTCSYAVLIFCKSEEAEAAVREMDGKMLYGRKLKVRAVKTSNNNLPLAFQNIKSVSRDLSQETKDRSHPVEPNVSFLTEPPKVDSTKPNQAQRDHTHAASVGGSLKNPFVHMPSNTSYSHVTTTGIPVAPPCSTSSFSNYMAPGYQWMWQSQHSNISYSSMPNLMYVPFSYPLYKLPNHAPFQSPVTHSSSCVPGINMKSNVNTQFGKDDGKPFRARPVKSVYSKDRQNSSGISRSIVHSPVASSTNKTKISEKDTGAKLMEDKPAVVKSVSEPISFFTSSSNAKLSHSETASQDNSLKMSVPVTEGSISGGKTTDCLSSTDKQNNVSGSSNLKSATPLRFPTSVPPSVTIPEASKPSVNPNSSSGVLTYSAKQAKVSSGVASQQEDSLSAGKMVTRLTCCYEDRPARGGVPRLNMKKQGRLPAFQSNHILYLQDWGVYPQLDTSSELPVIIIPNQLNFSQFKRIVKYLTDRHKDATRDQIVGTLEEIRRNKGGTFCGLTIPEIIYAVSSKLAESVPPA